LSPAAAAAADVSIWRLVVPLIRRRIGDRAFSVAAPRAWSRLPTQLNLLKQSTKRSTNPFRRQLKKFYFNLHGTHGNKLMIVL